LRIICFAKFHHGDKGISPFSKGNQKICPFLKNCPLQKQTILTQKDKFEDSSFSQDSSVQIQTDPSVPCRNGETGHHNYLSVQLLENTQSFDMLYNYN
jgi:hypothetical protein